MLGQLLPGGRGATAGIGEDLTPVRNLVRGFRQSVNQNLEEVKAFGRFHSHFLPDSTSIDPFEVMRACQILQEADRQLKGVYYSKQQWHSDWIAIFTSIVSTHPERFPHLETCSICTEDDVHLIPICAKEHKSCAECFLNAYWESSGGCRKSFAKCMFCRGITHIQVLYNYLVDGSPFRLPPELSQFQEDEVETPPANEQGQ